MTGAAVAGRTLAHDARSANVGAESKLTRWHARRPRLLENADSEFTHSQPPAREELREQSQLVWLPSGQPTFASGILAGQLPAPTVLGADQ
jgi:hypothetical protein